MVPLSMFDALSRAWNSMMAILFRPFDIGKWFGIGFCAWLAMLDQGFGNLNFNLPIDDESTMFFGEVFASVSEFISENASLFITLLVFGILLFIMIFIVLAWIASRGKFMLLDNLVHNRTGISAPWRAYAVQGNSLFLWALCFGLIMLGVLILLGGAVGACIAIFSDNTSGLVAAILILVPLFLAAVLAMALVWMMLIDFIVPVMFKHGYRAREAWRFAMPAIKRHFWHIVLYGLFKILVTLACSIAILLFGVVTCCCGLILVILPYIGAVVTLPITALMRLWSVEFMRGFGPEFDLYAVEGVDDPGGYDGPGGYGSAAVVV